MGPTDEPTGHEAMPAKRGRLITGWRQVKHEQGRRRYLPLPAATAVALATSGEATGNDLAPGAIAAKPKTPR